MKSFHRDGAFFWFFHRDDGFLWFFDEPPRRRRWPKKNRTKNKRIKKAELNNHTEKRVGIRGFSRISRLETLPDPFSRPSNARHCILMGRVRG